MEVVQKDFSGTLQWVRVDKKDTLHNIVEDSLADFVNLYHSNDVPEWNKWVNENLPNEEEDLKKPILTANKNKLAKDVEAKIISKRGVSH